MSQVAIELAHVAMARRGEHCSFSISTSNELFDKFAQLNDDLFAVSTFTRKWQAGLNIAEMMDLRRRLKERFQIDRTRAFVSLMSHIWSPLVAPVIRQSGVRHVVIVHDVDRHPGDRYSLASWWLLREAAVADRVIALSNTVARQLVAGHIVPEKKLSVLFLPDINYGGDVEITRRGSDRALRVLFIGRILPYKGLDILADAFIILRKAGVAAELGVFGRGNINHATQRKLSTLGAEVVNRWLLHDEFKAIFERYDVVVAAHTEASQSGVVAAAFGAGLPVIATPIGGLVDQVTPERTGLIAKSATAEALAQVIQALAENRVLLANLKRGVNATRDARSMERFFDEVHQVALAS